MRRFFKKTFSSENVFNYCLLIVLFLLQKVFYIHLEVLNATLKLVFCFLYLHPITLSKYSVTNQITHK